MHASKEAVERTVEELAERPKVPTEPVRVRQELGARVDAAGHGISLTVCVIP